VGSSFPNAALYHVTYPSILPSPDVFGGDTCGGILKEDANYAIGRVQRINDKIEEAAESSGAAVVDLENSFGENPLCPADPDLALAHGIPQERIEAVVAEVAGPDSPIYGELSSAVSRINSMARCIEAGVFFLSPFCALKWGGVDDAIDDLTEAFSANFEADVLKLFLAPGDTEDERAENFTFLFHPNANGQKVMACQVLDAWARDLAVYAPGSDCEPLVGSSLRVYEWDGDSILNMTPIRVVPDQRLPVVFNGFDYHSDVRVTYRSEPVDGGLFQTDSTGTLSTELVIPAELSPGVHTVSFEGTNNRTPRTIDVLIELDGEPEPLASYGTYFEGFQPYEAVHVTYQGIDFLDLTANQDGGLLVEVPVPARGEIQLGVVGETSGTTIDRAVDVAPLPVSQSLDSVVNTASLLGEAFPALGTEWAQVIALLSQGSQADSSRSAARAVAQATVAVEALDVDQVTGIPGTKAALVDWLLDIGQAYAGNEIAAATPDADGDKLDVARQLLGDADSDRSNGDSLQAALAYRDATIAAFDSNWWSLTRYGIVAFDDVDLRNSSIGGRILSGDATTLRSWSLGSDLAVDSSRVDIGVGGVIDIANGSVRSGSVTYGTLGQISSVSVRGTVEQASLPLDIESARDAVVAAVASIADAPANGNWVDVNPWWTTFRFKGTSPDVNVFDVEADQLENAHAVQIDAPPGALTVIRVSGDHYSAQQLSTIRVLNSQGASADAGNLIWMFTTASSVEIGPSLHWRGSILAPTATVTLHNSVPLDGSLIANSVLGAITHHWLPPVDHPQLP
jgi:choice-of-anchor A domain-containing protein